MTPITFAHRGGRTDEPENTLGAFRRALELGASGLETDAWLSGDGEVVLRHGPWLWTRLGGVVPRRCHVGRTSVARLVGWGVLRLADLYAELGADFELSIDLKTPGMGTEIAAVARERGDLARLWLCSASIGELHRLRQDLPDVGLVHSVRAARVQGGFERHAADLLELGVDTMNMHHRDWTAGLVALFHRFELRAFAWDVQEVRDLRAVLALGIDGIYSDHVARLVETVSDWEAPAS